MEIKNLDQPPYEVSEELSRFNPKYSAFNRKHWDPKFKDLSEKSFETQMSHIVSEDENYELEDYALMAGAWHVHSLNKGSLSGDGSMGNVGLYDWEDAPSSNLVREDSCPPAERHPFDADLEKTSSLLKEASKFYGASKAGITKLNDKWVYSHFYNPETDENKSLDISEDYRFAVVFLVEMRSEFLKYSPSVKASAETGLAYSKMAFIASSLAQFIRNLGYKAIPCGNDTALSIPLAIDAGLGQLGRNGLLITPWYGPRVRIAKVLTDMPLKENQPIEFGVTEFCESCKKCAEKCKEEGAGAISFDERTEDGPTISNNPGALKWYIDPEKCYEFWAENGIDCSTCISVCPFSRKEPEKILK